VGSQDAAAAYGQQHGQQRLRHYDVINSTTRRQTDQHASDYTDDAVDTSGQFSTHHYAAHHRCLYYLLVAVANIIMEIYCV